MLVVARPVSPPLVWDEKAAEPIRWTPAKVTNPVVTSCEYALAETNIVHISEDGVRKAAQYIAQRMYAESYTPRTWRTQPLHMCAPEPYSAADPLTKGCLDWIFLISSLNFSFWSERDGGERYGVEWRAGWGTETRAVHTGYWSLVAALNRALEQGIPITDPAFYASEAQCPDALIAYVFRAGLSSQEQVPLLTERIAIMRQVGTVLCSDFGGSYAGFLDAFHRPRRGRGSALELVQTVVDTFPSFRDERSLGGHPVCFWKRAQILVAETWAAFFPADPAAPHPLVPHGISDLTMFADYRVPQILHHLGILLYPPALQQKLICHADIPTGSLDEISLRAASVVSVERVRDAISALSSGPTCVEVSSVLIDFYLWDLAKRIEDGEDSIEGIDSVPILPAHRTRCTWY